MNLSKLNHCIDMQRNKEAENEEYLAELYCKFNKGISVGTKLYLMQLKRQANENSLSKAGSREEFAKKLKSIITDIDTIISDAQLEALSDWLDMQIKEHEDAKSCRWGL